MMPTTSQSTAPTQKALETAMNELSQMMATFKTYSGPHLDIDRGDFDVAFFRELYDRCATIQRNLSQLDRSGVRTGNGAEGGARQTEKKHHTDESPGFLETACIEAVAVAAAK